MAPETEARYNPGTAWSVQPSKTEELRCPWFTQWSASLLPSTRRCRHSRNRNHGNVEPDGPSIGSLWAVTSLLIDPLARYSLLVAGKQKMSKGAARTGELASLELTTFHSTATC